MSELSALLSDAIMSIVDTNESLQKSVQRQQEKENLKKKIDKLAKAVHKEKQFNRQIELNQQLKMLKKQWEEL